MTSAPAERREGGDRLTGSAQISLVDLLDRLIGSGVVLAGDVLISLAGVDLVEIRLHALITSVREDLGRPHRAGEVTR